jgi:hypothetical protein
MDTGQTGLTLAFSLAALRRLADPGGAVADARTWSTQVGVVTDRPPHALTTFTRRHGIENEFAPTRDSVPATLDHLAGHFETERLLLVDAPGEDRAPEGWQRLPVTEAADAAGWELSDPPAGTDTRLETSSDDWP